METMGTTLFLFKSQILPAKKKGNIEGDARQTTKKSQFKKKLKIVKLLKYKGFFEILNKKNCVNK